jgi:hypothetical protein
MLLLAVLAILGYRLDRAAVASIQSRIDARESEPGYSM